MEYESVESLTLLGQQLCREIARYETRINYAALIVEDKGTPISDPVQPEGEASAMPTQAPQSVVSGCTVFASGEARKTRAKKRATKKGA